MSGPCCRNSLLTRSKDPQDISIDPLLVDESSWEAHHYVTHTGACGLTVPLVTVVRLPSSTALLTYLYLSATI